MKFEMSHPYFKAQISAKEQISTQIFHYTLCNCAEECNKLTVLISASLRPGNSAAFYEMSQQWRAVGNTVSDLTRPIFEP